MKPIFITFSGIDGAGKSTQIEMLRRHFDEAGISIRQLAFWDDVVMFRRMRSGFSRVVLQSDGSVGSPEKPANRNDKNAQAWPLLAGRAFLHLFDVFSLRRIVRKLKSQNATVVIFDRYIYDQLAAMPMDSRLARAYARVLLKLSPAVDLACVLDVVPEVARARKPEYPVEFMHQQRRSYLALRNFTPLQIIAPAGPDDVHNAIVEHLQRVITHAAPQTQVHPAIA